MASCDPMESPSGRACDERTKRCRERIASTMRWRSEVGVVIRDGSRGLTLARSAGALVQLVEELLDAILAGDRFVVDELQIRHAPQPQARSDLTAEEGSGALERARRALFGLCFGAGRAERGVIHASVLKVGRHLDARDRDEPDAGVVHFAREQIPQLAANLIGDAIGTRSL